MRMLRCFLPLVWLLAVDTTLAQAPTPSSDDRSVRIVERYKAMLAANPVEGLPLERLWKDAEEHGSTAQLLESYRAASVGPKADLATWIVYGHLLKKAGKLDEAALAYERAGELDPSSPLPALAAGDLATLRSQPQAAAESYALAVARLPKDDRRKTDLLFKAGVAWSTAGNPTKATESWEKIVELKPTDLDLRRRLAETYEKTRLAPQALSHYEYIEAHGSPSERAAALRDQGHLHEVRGEFDAARDALERGLALTARDNWLHGDLQTRLIRLYQRAGRVVELEARWRASTEKAPRDLGTWEQLEALAEAQGNLAEERASLEKMVSLVPGDRDHSLKLAGLFADSGDRDRAAAIYDGLLKLRPDDFDSILLRADLDVQLAQPDSAIRRIEARIDQNPANESVTGPALEFFLSHHLDQAAEKRFRAEVALRPASVEASLALVKFLLSLHKIADARLVMEAMVDAVADATGRGDRWMQAAECFKQQNLPDDALRCWQQAALFQPSKTGPLLAQAEIRLVRGEQNLAIEVLKRAVEISAPGSERQNAEHKLFDAWQGGSPLRPSPIPPSSGGRSTHENATGLRANKRTTEHLAELANEARASPSAENYLRLARWQSWSHLLDEAVVSATRAVDLAPDQIPAREQLVDLLAALGRWPEVEIRLQEISALDPARRSACLRQIANLKLESGATDEAIAIFTELQQETPGSRSALTDLALALERADRWYDALAIWERAYLLSGMTPAQRDEVRRPLVIACEHLDQFARGWEVLRDAVDERDDLAVKQEAFEKMADFCRRHDLGGQLVAEYEARLVTQPDDYFTLISLAKLRQDAGLVHESYRLLVHAYYASPDPVRTLRGIVDLAQEIGEYTEAVEHQRRLMVLPGQATAENIERLAALEEANLDEDAATKTWDKLVAKFPRDTAVLKKAADFSGRIGDMSRERDLLAQVTALDAADLVQTARLARLHVEVGNIQAALACFQQVMDRTQAEQPGTLLQMPVELSPTRTADAFKTGTTISRSLQPGTLLPAHLSAAQDDLQLRLETIREMSLLLFPAGARPGTPVETDARRCWVDHWCKAADSGARSEALTAFFYSGQAALTLECFARWMKDDTGSESGVIETGFLSAGLRFGEYRRIAEWSWGDPVLARRVHRGQLLQETLGRFLAAGGEPGPTMISELFPPSLKVRETLWDAARDVFAANHHYAQAIELGDRVLTQVTTGRAAYAAQVAEWALYLGQLDHARAALHDAVEEGGGVTLDASVDPAFTALRAYYLLLPSGQRAAFAAGYLQRIHARGDHVHHTLAAVLLHGLADEKAAARHDLDALLALRLTTTGINGLSPDTRRWAYLLAAGQQLQIWNLDWMAEYLWRAAWNETGAYDRQASESAVQVAEIRRRLLGVQVALATDPTEALARAQTFVHDLPSAGVVATEAQQMAAEAQRPTARWLYESLCHHAPLNADDWHGLFSVEADTRLADTLETTLASWCDGTRPLPSGVDPTELCCRLATVRESNGDRPGAIRLLEKARQTSPGILAILLPLAQTYERAVRWQDAANVWREALPLDADGTSRLGLASAQEHLGHLEESATLLKTGAGTGSAAAQTEAIKRLVQLTLARGKAGEARQLALDLVRDRKLEALAEIAAVFTANGQQAVADELLSNGIRRTQGSTVRFHLQKALVEQTSAVGGDCMGLPRRVQRLEMLANGSPTLLHEYEQVLCILARSAGTGEWLESTLRRHWEDGRGEPWAGAALLDVYLRAHREAALCEVVAAFGRRSGLDESTLGALELVLTDSHPALALSFAERLLSRAPQNENYALNQAELLWRCGRQVEANALLEAREATSVFSETITIAMANRYARLGDKRLARRYFEQAMARDPAAIHAPQIYLQLARLDLDEKRLPEAKKVLQMAYRQPACEDLAPLVDYLVASGEPLVGSGMPASDFPMSFERRAHLLMMIRDHLVRLGLSEKADKLLDDFPEFLVAVPERITSLVNDSASANLPGLAASLEKALDWDGSGGPRLKRGLIALYTRWAEEELKFHQNSDRARELLTRAHELEPDDFGVAKQLAQVCLGCGQIALAEDALARFLGSEGLPVERVEANQMLGRR